MVESTSPKENERGRIWDNIIAHPIRVGVGDEIVVRPIVHACRSEVKSNESKVFPSLSTSVTEDDEGAAWCNRV